MINCKFDDKKPRHCFFPPPGGGLQWGRLVRGADAAGERGPQVEHRHRVQVYVADGNPRLRAAEPQRRRRLHLIGDHQRVNAFLTPCFPYNALKSVFHHTDGAARIIH